MLDGLFGSKFTNKCKHCVKYIRARLDPIRKKKEAVVWYLKRDVAELLSHGHDLNAFSRMETLIIEMNQESCYNMIEQYCEDILNQLKVIEKQRECPDEAREAVSTLIFAAARFPDLRELREIRQIFTEKFGGQMESFVNSEFMNNTQEKSFSDERKIKVMQNISMEFSIGFDSKSLKWKLANPAQAKYDEPKTSTPEIRTESKESWSKPKELRAEPQELRSKPKELRAEQKELRAKPEESRTELKDLRYKPKEVRAEPKELPSELREVRYKPKELPAQPKEVRTEPKELPSEPRELRYKPKELLAQPKEVRAEPKELRYKPKEEPRELWPKLREFRAEPKDIHEIPKKTDKTYAFTDHALNDTPKKNTYVQKTKDNSFHSEKPGLGSIKSLSEKEQGNIGSVLDRLQVKDNGSDFLKPDPTRKIIPPPYTKPNTPRLGKNTEQEVFDSDPYLAEKQYIRPGNEDNRPVRVPAPPYVKPSNNNEKPKPVSVRSRIPKPQIISETNNNHNESALYDAELLARSESKNKKHRNYDDNHKYENNDHNYAKEFGKAMGRTSSSKTRQSHAELDQEDCSIDYGNLLRGPSRGNNNRKHKRKDDEERVMDKLLMHYSRKGVERRTADQVRHGSTVDRVRHGPGRAVSLPTDPVREEEGEFRGPVRAVSLQGDGGNGGRVHPNLPDFDELAKRVQELRRA